MVWIVGGVLAFGVVGAVVSSVVEDPGVRHPEPRAASGAGDVVPPARYASHPRIHEGYRAAERSAAVLDGVFCYCYCGQHAGHYSLLDCFKTDHAARCDVCLSEASLVDRMTRDGADLEGIRARVDAVFGA